MRRGSVPGAPPTSQAGSDGLGARGRSATLDSPMSTERKPPRLRPVEAIFVHDRARGRVLVLRDTEGIAPGPVVVPAELAPVVLGLDGARTALQIAAAASHASGRPVH